MTDLLGVRSHDEQEKCPPVDRGANLAGAEDSAFER
jgi:hypothetical protein